MSVVPLPASPALFRHRVARFAAVGASCAVLQLLLFAALTSAGVRPLLAEVIAFAAAAQCNFVLSVRFTWADRGGQLWSRRWSLFALAVGASALLNIAVFAVARSMSTDLVASALGIGAAAVVNYLLGDYAVFTAATSKRSVHRGD